MNNLILDIEYEYIPLIKSYLICEICWSEVDNNMNLVKSNNYLIKDKKNYIVNKLKKEPNLIHNINYKEIEEKGVYFDDIINILLKDINNSTKLIGHNIISDITHIINNIKYYNFYNNMKIYEMSKIINVYDTCRDKKILKLIIDSGLYKKNSCKMSDIANLLNINYTNNNHRAEEDNMTLLNCIKELNLKYNLKLCEIKNYEIDFNKRINNLLYEHNIYKKNIINYNDLKINIENIDKYINKSIGGNSVSQTINDVDDPLSSNQILSIPFPIEEIYKKYLKKLGSGRDKKLISKKMNAKNLKYLKKKLINYSNIYKNSNICLFVSEISAFIGENKFVNKNEAINKVLFRNKLINTKPKSVLYKDYINNIYNNNYLEKYSNNIIFEDIKLNIETIVNTNINLNKENLSNNLLNQCKSDIKFIVNSILGKIRCNIGINNELKAIKLTEKLLNKKISEPLIKKYKMKSYTGIPYILYAKTDGYIESDDLIIEVKTRTGDKLYNKYYSAEMTQMQLYMKIFNKKKLLFIEYNQDNIYTEIIEYNEYLINNILHKIKITIDNSIKKII
tara:strand:- start:3762 stop:5453 length:1692 start_codon:yes stop_codon:yes gene_type:complete